MNQIKFIWLTHNLKHLSIHLSTFKITSHNLYASLHDRYFYLFPYPPGIFHRISNLEGLLPMLFSKRHLPHLPQHILTTTLPRHKHQASIYRRLLRTDIIPLTIFCIVLKVVSEIVGNGSSKLCRKYVLSTHFSHDHYLRDFAALAAEGIRASRRRDDSVV
jgi:hypothetical protein